MQDVPRRHLLYLSACDKKDAQKRYVSKIKGLLDMHLGGHTWSSFPYLISFPKLISIFRIGIG